MVQFTEEGQIYFVFLDQELIAYRRYIYSSLFFFFFFLVVRLSKALSFQIGSRRKIRPILQVNTHRLTNF